MRARNYDIPPQVAHRQYTDEFMDVWRYYRDYLDKILIEKNMNSIQTLYVVIEDEVLKYKGPEGRIGVAEASTKLLNIVTTALAFIKKNA